MLEKEFKVEAKHSAAEIGSGNLAVLSTPSLIAFMENAAKEEAKSRVSAGETTVGVEINMKHLKATAIGQTVKIKAALAGQKKSILFYDIEALEGETIIGKAEHRRAIVNEEQFMRNL